MTVATTTSPASAAPVFTRLHAAMVFTAACTLAAGLGGWMLYHDVMPPRPPKPAGPMLLAPMVSVIEPCILTPSASAPTLPADLTASCAGTAGSASALIEATLARLQPQAGGAPYPLGYTLPVPLLQLFRTTDRGWEIDADTVGRVVRTVRDNPRPLVLYLFSTHFATDAPLEAALAHNPENLAQTRDGPLPTGRYYGADIHNWTFAKTDTEITARRVQAIQAVLAGICQLAPRDRAKIRGVTLLGELHHLFPDFQAGMGFTPPYRVTDYSPASVAAFRRFLQQEFKTVARLNRFVDGGYTSFDEVAPPSRDIRTERLQRYTDHIDAYAQGSLPVSGWAFTGGAPAWVHVYRDGVFAGKTPVGLSRQDVLQAKPEFGDANTGWRLDLDFRALPAGLHRIDVFLEQRPGVLQPIGTRQIAIMDRRQQPPQPAAQQPLPVLAHAAADAPPVQAAFDQPADQASYYYNPLVPLWHRFRAQQVAAYLRYFDQVVGASCLADTPHYTHQIVPFTNPSWDANKFAIQASLQKMGTLRLGVSLYGESSYGDSFPQWYRRTAHDGYGVTEFHPLKAMDAATLRHVLDAHAARGAEFLSFFLEPQWHGQLVARGHNLFSFDADNAQFQSNQLYTAMQQLLAPPGPIAPGAPRAQPKISAPANTTP